MIKDVNYFIAGIVIVAVIGLIIFLIRRNRKDEKRFEKDMIDSEIKPEKHKDDQI